MRTLKINRHVKKNKSQQKSKGRKGRKGRKNHDRTRKYKKLHKGGMNRLSEWVGVGQGIGGTGYQHMGDAFRNIIKKTLLIN